MEESKLSHVCRLILLMYHSEKTPALFGITLVRYILKFFI
jgi:hypothetical protein